MWDKLLDVSKIMIIPAMILYLAGFICITGYYAQFGIVTFDIINARFLIAGFNCVVPMVLCLWAAWQLRVYVLEEGTFSYKGRWNRYRVYFGAATLPFLVSWVLQLYFGLVSLKREPDPGAVSFTPAGKWDLPHRFLEVVAPPAPSAFRAILGTFVYAVLFLTTMGLLLLAVAAAVHFTKKYTTKKAETRNEEAAPLAAAEVIAPSEVVKPTGKQIALMLLSELVIVAAFIAVTQFCFDKIKSELVDPVTLGNLTFDPTILTCWCYFTVLALAFAMVTYAKEKISLKSIWQPENPFSIGQTAQLTVIPALLAIFLFGAVIFPRLPFAMGGGQPRLVTMQFKEKDRLTDRKQMFLIGESSQYFFAVEKNHSSSHAYQINKDIVGITQTFSYDAPIKKQLHTPTAAPKPDGTKKKVGPGVL